MVDALSMTTQETETTSFLDTNSGVNVGSSAIENPFDTADAVTSAGLSEFFKRPVRIYSGTWSTSDTPGVFTAITPWYAYFNNANVKYKLNNFAFMRANLHLKFVINASPFYYGSMRASYQPIPSFKPPTIVAGTSNGQANSELIPYSQQPGVWLKPQHSEGADMVLPFFYPRSYLRAQLASDYLNMGTLTLLIYNALQSANGVTGQGVSVQIYAWAEDVVLAGPTVGLSMQTDEYGTGPVSGPASTVAKIAGMVKGVPIIGKFATATEMGARAVSGIAKLFGFTNVPVIEPTQPLRPSPFPQLASPELGFPTEKLTLDSKNELSIDPTIVGLPPHDELSIEHFVSRQSYLTSANWTTATAVDTPLFTTKVTPCMWQGSYGSYTAPIQYTPLALASMLFKSWRGDIIFTFRFIASPFHKGRVRISYDPYGSAVQTTSDTGPVVFNKIVDLSAETEVDVRIPYQQALAWCYTYDSVDGNVPYTTSSSPALTYNDTFDNGVLSVKVLTLLTAPVASSNINMQVFVRGADNMEFGNPKQLAQNESAFGVQSEEYVEEKTGEEHTMGENDGAILVERCRVHFGESVRSFRQLLRRQNLIDVLTPASATTTRGVYSWRQFKCPPTYGFVGGAPTYFYGLVTPATAYQCNYVNTTPWHLLSNCFIAQRGSMQWHYNYESPVDTTVSVRRITSQVTTNANFATAIAPGSDAANVKNYVDGEQSYSGGAAVTNQTTNAGLSVSIPNYTVFKFQTTNPFAGTGAAQPTQASYDGSCFEAFQVSVAFDGTVSNPSLGRLARYFGVGTDYNLHFFLNCPSQRYCPRSSLIPQ